MQHIHQRHNIYAGIHKGMRAMMGQALVNAGRTDWSDAVDREAALVELRELCAFCRAHLDHENAFIHPAMEAGAPGSAHRVADEHEEHLVAIAALERQMDVIAAATGALRLIAGEALYRQLALFVAENVVHMNVEETEHNAVLWAHYSDTEIDAIHQALVSSLSPQETMQCLRWMLCFSSHDERIGILTDLRDHAPPPVFEAVLTMLRPLLGDRDRAKLDAALLSSEARQAA